MGVKRAFDLTSASLALVLSCPLLALVALLIKRGDRGPIFYKGTRVGQHGRHFQMYKFRTMVIDADMIGGPSTASDDPRITRVGGWLRRTKLDELPQLLNVVRGEMSIVGPRPEVPVYAELYTVHERQILLVRPGLTDLATLWNVDEGGVLAGAADPEQVYLEKIRPEKLSLQLEYVRRQNFRTDLWIIWQTILTVVLRREPTALEVLSDARSRPPRPEPSPRVL